MRNKIAWKLTLYFSVVLLLFSLIIGSVFTVLFRSYTINLQKNELETRAVTMAEALAKSTDETTTGSGIKGNRQSGYGFYLRFLDEIAMTDAWVVDENLQLITGNQLAGNTYLYADLPQNAESVVKEVFLGNTTFSEGFSSLLNTPTLTVGTPIRSSGEIIGALLLHSPVEGINEPIKQGYQILAVSMVAALILSSFLSIILAVAFSKPLQKMKNVAMQ
ncbi:MAG TPA: two-component sensor histidine kinase, partial [Bacillota bacterium]|nr:two-component sensor histidine kinase [Bacillota bacterium]